ncbi:hypothetical protein DMENIID0001_168990 [Sergentomyia squamirostris]
MSERTSFHLRDRIVKISEKKETEVKSDPVKFSKKEKEEAFGRRNLILRSPEGKPSTSSLTSASASILNSAPSFAISSAPTPTSSSTSVVRHLDFSLTDDISKEIHKTPTKQISKRSLVPLSLGVTPLIEEITRLPVIPQEEYVHNRVQSCDQSTSPLTSSTLPSSAMAHHTFSIFGNASQTGATPPLLSFEKFFDNIPLLTGGILLLLLLMTKTCTAEHHVDFTVLSESSNAYVHDMGEPITARTLRDAVHTSLRIKECCDFRDCVLLMVHLHLPQAQSRSLPGVSGGAANMGRRQLIKIGDDPCSPLSLLPKSVPINSYSLKLIDNKVLLNLLAPDTF